MAGVISVGLVVGELWGVDVIITCGLPDGLGICCTAVGTNARAGLTDLGVAGACDEPVMITCVPLLTGGIRMDTP